MIICVFDTETINADKTPFCYNVGYLIADTDTQEILLERDFVVEQHWHNLALFATAYYAEKRKLYIDSMRARKSVLDKWGYIMRTMAKDLREHKVECAYAYNSPFDDRVFEYNCDWFKTNNPLENIPVMDIRGMVHSIVGNSQDFFKYCETYERFTDSGNYSTTAETIYGYAANCPEFEEEHTALADARIEYDIILWAMANGAKLEKEYPVLRSLPRMKITPFKIKVDGKIIHEGEYVKKYIREGLYSFTTPDRD